jgi:selenocysteine-specific elongation factor
VKHIIIGTAGHVDHGKTTLIKALTGEDTDRLKEEKDRGISIDLGFAALDLGGEFTAGIVDVPGHERYLKNMLAGTGGLDMIMLVIGADEGIMPQTIEHLAMLQLLGIKKGIVVLNKVDKVDEEWLEIVEDDLKGLLKDTFLMDAPVCKVSAVTGQGLESLKAVMWKVAQSIVPREIDAPFRLWVDRVFKVKGHGVVITGSALSGKLAVGNNLILRPSNLEVRVRGLECHGAKVDEVFAGQRAALNIGGVESDAITRGMFITSPSRGLVNQAWDLVITWRQEVASGTRVRFHLGTGEFIGRLYRYKNASDRYMRLILEKPLAAAAGDRGVIRLYSPQVLLGGATVVAPAKPSRKLSDGRRALADALDGQQTIRTIIQKALGNSEQPITMEALKEQAGYVSDKKIEAAVKSLVDSDDVILIGSYYITAYLLAALTGQLTTLLASFHQEQPERPGLSRETARKQLGINEKVWEALLGAWQSRGLIKANGSEIALVAFANNHRDWKIDIIDQVEKILPADKIENIDTLFLGEKLGVTTDFARKAHEVLLKDGILVRVGDLVVYRKTIQYIAILIQRHLSSKGSLSVAELRDMLGTTRKVAIPLMEYLDMHKYTIREGDIRRAGPRLRDLSE